MERSIEAELLDILAADDPRAMHSRRDLGKINAAMGNARIMARALGGAFGGATPRGVVEIGAGDGRFALEVARRIGGAPKGATIVLVDRAEAVRPETRQLFERLGWHARPVVADVFDWIERPPAGPCDAVMANLFLHHFSEAQLITLMKAMAKRALLFVAVEPRRSAWRLCFARLLWPLGCNDVTRHDAPVSVRAGFAGRELSALWPQDPRWAVEERAAGLFSHLFVAQRSQ